MKGFKKIFYIFIATLMLFTLSVTAFAGNETNDGNIKIQVATDKGSYGATGVAEITATITNVSGEDINNVTAQAVFDDLAPAGKRKSQTSKSVDVLKSGESFSFTYKATLNKDEHKLNIFQKIILWFVRLFNGGYNADNESINVVTECVTEIEFGKFTANNVVQVVYKKTNTTSADYEQWFADIDKDHIVYTDANKSNGYINNRIIIVFHSETTEKRKQEIVESLNGTVIGKTENKYQIKIPESKTSEELSIICSSLGKMNGVFFAFYETVMRDDDEVSIFQSTPNDPWKDTVQGITGTDWNENNPDGLNWGLEVIEAPSAWNYNNQFKKVKIGVVDSGFETNHEDLDISILNPQGNLNDKHGTHVAGIIGATANNGKGITGIVWNKELYGVANKNNKNDISTLSVYEAIETCLKKGCKVVNLSQAKLNLNETEIKENGLVASQYILYWQLELGIDDFIIVQGAGNRNYDAKKSGFFSSISDDGLKVYFEDCENSFKEMGINSVTDLSSKIYSHFMVVGAIQKSGNGYKLCDEDLISLDIHQVYSCYGENISVVAPGKKIFSTLPMGGVDGSYGYDSGTSMATPMVSGVASLVWSVNPNFTSGEVKDIVCNYTNKTAKGYGNDTRTYPIVNAKLAVEEAIRRKNRGFGTLSGKIIDKENSEPIKNVTVRVTKDNVTQTTLTDENGVFKLELPVGDWKITFTSDTHTYDEYAAVKIEKDVDRVLQYPIYMTKKASVSTITGTVINSKVGNPIWGVNISVIDNNGDSLEPVTTTITDENGRYSLMLPYGNYSLSFNYDYYEYYGISLTADSPSYTRNIQLTPSDSNYICSVLIPTVKDSVTNENIYNVTVQIVNGFTNQIVKNLTISDSNSNPFPLPYGMYRIKFSHENYDDNWLEVYINSDLCILSTMYLTPKKEINAIKYNGNYYRIYDEGMTWTQAKKYCETLGGHLVTITSQEEQAFIETLLDNADKNSYWIGAEKINDKWSWVTSEKWEYTNWAHKQPDNNRLSPFEDSLMMYNKNNPNATSVKGTWNDLYYDGTCGSEAFFGIDNFGFICEWETTPSI